MGSDVFEEDSKNETFEQKLKLWHKRISICDFSNLESLNNFMQTCKWKTETTNLESIITSTVHEPLEVLQQNLGVYFPEDNYLSLNSLLWIVQPFTNEDFDSNYLTNKLVNLQSDLVKKAEFKLIQTTLIFGCRFSAISNTKLLLKKRFPSFFACLQHTIASKGFLFC